MNDTIDEVVNESLEYLLKEYLANGGADRYSIDEIVYLKYNKNPELIGEYMAEQGLVKNQFYAPKGFAGTITMKGILRIKPNYLDQYRNKIISVLGATEKKDLHILKILSFEPKDYLIAFDIAKSLEDEEYIEVHELKFDDLMINLTEKGLVFYEKTMKA